MKFSFKDEVPAIAEGEFDGKVVDIGIVYGTYGPGIKIVVAPLNKELKGVTINGVQWLRKDPKGQPYIANGSELQKWIGAILGDAYDPDEEFDIDNLKDKMCTVVTKHSEPDKQGRIYANIDAIKKYTGIKQSDAVAKESPAVKEASAVKEEKTNTDTAQSKLAKPDVAVVEDVAPEIKTDAEVEQEINDILDD